MLLVFIFNVFYINDEEMKAKSSPNDINQNYQGIKYIQCQYKQRDFGVPQKKYRIQ